jgi:hypothetical protein
LYHDREMKKELFSGTGNEGDEVFDEVTVGALSDSRL